MLFIKQGLEFVIAGLLADCPILTASTAVNYVNDLFRAKTTTLVCVNMVTES